MQHIKAHQPIFSVTRTVPDLFGVNFYMQLQQYNTQISNYNSASVTALARY